MGLFVQQMVMHRHHPNVVVAQRLQPMMMITAAKPIRSKVRPLKPALARLWPRSFVPSYRQSPSPERSSNSITGISASSCDHPEPYINPPCGLSSATLSLFHVV